MREDLIDLLERADLALASSAGVIEEAKLAPLIKAVGAVRTRLAYPEDILVVALAGGTGSGKSSLFNAFCGEELVDVGGVRPTTSLPAAAVPAAVGSAMDGYLDSLGVEQRHSYQGTTICLLDLPDTDSVETEHRHRVDAVLPLVDLVVWVTDPEKYRDARLHHEYLKPMSAYAGQFLVVLNQVDRLQPDQVEQVAADLSAALREDEMEDPGVIVMAAAPPVGPPLGLDEFMDTLQERTADRAALYEKLLTDLAETSYRLHGEAGTGLDFDVRANDTIGIAAEALVGGHPDEATDALSGFLESLVTETGGVTATRIGSVAAAVPAHVMRIEKELSRPELPTRRRWWRRPQPTDNPSQGADQARALLSESVVRPVRATLARRAVAVAAVAELAVAVESLRNKPSG